MQQPRYDHAHSIENNRVLTVKKSYNEIYSIIPAVCHSPRSLSVSINPVSFLSRSFFFFLIVCNCFFFSFFLSFFCIFTKDESIGCESEVKKVFTILNCSKVKETREVNGKTVMKKLIREDGGFAMISSRVFSTRS